MGHASFTGASLDKAGSGLGDEMMGKQDTHEISSASSSTVNYYCGLIAGSGARNEGVYVLDPDFFI